MTVATSTVAVTNVAPWLFPGFAMAPEDLPLITVTGPVAGIWTITAPDSVSQAALDAAVALQVKSLTAQSNYDKLITDATAALETNRTESAQNAAIITAANTMLAFAGTSLTQAQTISTLKDLATGVKMMAVHDQTNKVQLNYLIRLAVGKTDGTN